MAEGDIKNTNNQAQISDQKESKVINAVTKAVLKDLKKHPEKLDAIFEGVRDDQLFENGQGFSNLKELRNKRLEILEQSLEKNIGTLTQGTYKSEEELRQKIKENLNEFQLYLPGAVAGETKQKDLLHVKDKKGNEQETTYHKTNEVGVLRFAEEHKLAKYAAAALTSIVATPLVGAMVGFGAVAAEKSGHNRATTDEQSKTEKLVQGALNKVEEGVDKLTKELNNKKVPEKAPTATNTNATAKSEDKKEAEKAEKNTVKNEEVKPKNNANTPKAEDKKVEKPSEHKAESKTKQEPKPFNETWTGKALKSVGDFATKVGEDVADGLNNLLKGKEKPIEIQKIEIAPLDVKSNVKSTRVIEEYKPVAPRVIPDETIVKTEPSTQKTNTPALAEANTRKSLTGKDFEFRGMENSQKEMENISKELQNNKAHLNQTAGIKGAADYKDAATSSVVVTEKNDVKLKPLENKDLKTTSTNFATTEIKPLNIKFEAKKADIPNEPKITGAKGQAEPEKTNKQDTKPVEKPEAAKKDDVPPYKVVDKGSYYQIVPNEGYKKSEVLERIKNEAREAGLDPEKVAGMAKMCKLTFKKIAEDDLCQNGQQNASFKNAPAKTYDDYAKLMEQRIQVECGDKILKGVGYRIGGIGGEKVKQNPSLMISDDCLTPTIRQK